MNLDDLPKSINHPFAAAVAGALIGLRYAPGDSWWGRFSNVFAGVSTSIFLAPAIAEYLKLVSNESHAALAFAVGMFGMSLAAAIMQALREIKFSEIISGWFSRRG